jgi:cyclic pyranopterin phosphate synthase
VKENLRDGFGRQIDYLRISVTDRCNLRCVYCMPKEGVRFLPASRILRYEELLRLTDLFLTLGVRKVRITGGEPLIRKNIRFLFRELGNREQLGELVLTTNGTLLSEHASDIRAAGVRRVNVSLDTLNPATFEKITGSHLHEKVVAGIKDAIALGLRIKVNVVVMKGVNDREVQDFVQYGIENCMDICFIELMPHASNSGIARELFVPRREIISRIEESYSLFPIRKEHQLTTADVFGVERAQITIGFISALSHPFCKRCNRVRLTPDGMMKTCLFGEPVLDLKWLIVSGATDEQIFEKIARAVREKEARHNLQDDWKNLTMNRVGG